MMCDMRLCSHWSIKRLTIRVTVKRPEKHAIVLRRGSLPPSPPPQHTHTIQGAVTALNGLQTNAAVLEQIRRSGSRRPKEMTEIYHYLQRINLKVEFD